jgi:Domain of unknown function (DUF1858)
MKLAPAKETGEVYTPRPVSVGPEDKPGPIVDAAPELSEVFARFGFAALQNPLLRRTLARQITIRQACRMHDVDETALLAALNTTLSRDGESPIVPFPILGESVILEPAGKR